MTKRLHGASVLVATLLLMVSHGMVWAQRAVVLPAQAVAMAPSAALNVKTTPIRVLMADPQAAPIVTAILPHLASHPDYQAFKGFTLVQIAPYSKGDITEQKLGSIQKGLDGLKH